MTDGWNSEAHGKVDSLSPILISDRHLYRETETLFYCVCVCVCARVRTHMCMHAHTCTQLYHYVLLFCLLIVLQLKDKFLCYSWFDSHNKDSEFCAFLAEEYCSAVLTQLIHIPCCAKLEFSAIYILPSENNHSYPWRRQKWAKWCLLIWHSACFKHWLFYLTYVSVPTCCSSIKDTTTCKRYCQQVS